MAERRPVAVPKPASSILLIRDGQRGVEVLMTERAMTMKFAPGAFVFPGGKVDRQDKSFWRWQGRTTGAKAYRDLPYRVAALRELYEEAGVLHMEEPVGDAHLVHRIPARVPFSRVLEIAGGLLDTASLVPFAHWVTPEPMPRRFDTYFYLAAHKGQAARHDGSEAVSMKWVSPRQLLADWEAERTPLMFPTRLNLMKLARASTVTQALLDARRASVVRTLPEVNMRDRGVRLTIDAATGYGVTEATEREVNVERP